MRVKVINKRPASVLQKKRVCAYARVSTDSRRQEDSLENQMETYERLITGNPEYEFIGVFADQGISGYCENRPQFQRMMEKARAGEIDLIITKSISRFARNTVTVLKFARELKECQRHIRMFWFNAYTVQLRNGLHRFSDYAIKRNC